MKLNRNQRVFMAGVSLITVLFCMALILSLTGSPDDVYPNRVTGFSVEQVELQNCYELMEQGCYDEYGTEETLDSCIREGSLECERLFSP